MTALWTPSLPFIITRPKWMNWFKQPSIVAMAGNAVQVDASSGAVRIKGNAVVVAGNTDQCCCGGATGPCPGSVAAGVTTYAISGYSDTMFTMFAGGCTNPGITLWDGTFTRLTSTSSHWPGTGCTVSGSLCSNRQMHSQRLLGYDTGGIGGVMEIGFFGPSGVPCWQMNIDACCSVGGFRYSVWQGGKGGGATPSGVYTRIGGTDSHATVTII